MTIRDIEPELRKRYLLRKYGGDIERIADKVFRVWTNETLPLAMEIVKEEELGYLETWLLLDTILLETVKGLLERHRTAENEAYIRTYMEGDENGKDSGV